MDLQLELGGIDIYLLDQVMRGNVPRGSRILDAGCGGGRNLVYFWRQGFDVWGLDVDPGAVAAVRGQAAAHGVSDVQERFRCESIETSTLEAAAFDFVICNAVLHFARDRAHFDAMVEGLARAVRPGGRGFCRLISTIGIERFVQPAPGEPEGRTLLGDGSVRFAVDLPDLLQTTQRLGLEMVEPVKAVNVQNLRCMTNWVWRRVA